jgi:hypothetical protein
MSGLGQKMEEKAVHQVRANPSYTSGLFVNGGEVMSAYFDSPWVKSTNALNNDERSQWAKQIAAHAVGFAVVYRVNDGTDYRTVLNPKSSCGIMASNTGKSANMDHDFATDDIIEAELNFAGGKTIAPTVIASRTVAKPRGGTLSEKPVDPPAALDSTGKETKQSNLVTETVAGTNNTTGTIAYNLSDPKSLTILPKLPAFLSAFGIKDPVITLPPGPVTPPALTGPIGK